MNRIFLGLILMFGSLAFAGPNLIVRSHTFVQNSDDIYLGDIVEMEHLPSNMQQSLNSVKLSQGPQLGERQVLSSDSISRLIRKQLSQLDLPEKVRLKIPRQVIVENRGYTLMEKDVKRRLKKHWKSYCQDCEFQISQLRLPKTKSQVQPMQWSLVLDGQAPRGQFSYAIRVGDRNIGWAQGMVRLFREVPVAARAIHFGERLMEKDFSLAKKEITYSHDSPADQQQLMGRRVRRALRAGEVIWSNTLEKVMAARRGQPVKMVIGSKDWQLSLQGIAQMDGQVGDTISVKNPKSNKIVSGILTGDREVHIQ